MEQNLLFTRDSIANIVICTLFFLQGMHICTHVHAHILQWKRNQFALVSIDAIGA